MRTWLTGGREIAQLVQGPGLVPMAKVFTATPDNPSPVPGPHMVKRERSNTHKLYSGSHVLLISYVLPSIHHE